MASPPRTRNRRKGLRPPPGLRALSLTIAGQELAVLNHPMADAVLSRKLTPAEAQIVSALVSGHSNAQIAKARGRSTRTVGNQIASIFRKLGVRSRAELLAVLFAET